MNIRIFILKFVFIKGGKGGIIIENRDVCF